ncbi:transglutaminase domain-containing protein [Robertkochia solimangrovi]|uniref:transglutaminase domain-containing protein n=1 Tax=Robertkochia solimangrovi TaxID=2213046 RepID=UPI001180861A|nr:transglutaminase domain-containing protein [Robertkochia solimangrovi]TRZ44379.1 transglutaminase [Robertkochia solimangrovi]
MKKLIVSCFLLVGAASVSMGQNYKFGKVSEEEIEEKQHPLEPDAAAAYLFKERSSYFTYYNGEIKLITEIQERVKIYNKDGFDYATETVYLRDGSEGADVVSGLKAVTYTMVDGKIEETKLEKDGIFKEEISKGRIKETFTLPNIKEGCVVEYKYRITSPYYFYIPEYRFQLGVPIKRLESSFSAPEYFKFKPLFKGYMPVRPEVDKVSSQIVDGYNLVEKYELDNVPSMKGEAFVDNIDNYRSSVYYELNQIEIPGSYYKSYSHNWNDVTKSIYGYSSFGDELKKTGYFEDELNPLIAATSNPQERIAIIFNFVKQKMNWNEYVGYGCSDGVRKAFKEGVGNVAEINLMMTSMMRFAGITANPVLVSTKSNGIPLYPTSDGFNYVICGIELNEGIVLLDATEKFALPNILPHRVLNWNGRMIRENGSSVEVDMTPAMSSKEVMNMQVKIDPQGAIDGKLRRQVTDHLAYEFRSNYFNVDNEEYLEKLENRYLGIEVDEYQLDDMENLGKPITETYSFHKDTGVEFIDGKIYVSPLFFLTDSENPLKLDKREFPLDFVYPKQDRFMINIGLPEGYKIETLPESAALSLPDNLGKFTYVLKSAGNNVQVMVTSEINTDIVPALYYDALKEYFNQVIKKQSEKLVLIKA